MGRTGRGSGGGRSFSSSSGRSFSGGMRSPSSGRTRSASSPRTGSTSSSRPSYSSTPSSYRGSSRPTFVNVGSFNRGTNYGGGSSYNRPPYRQSGRVGRFIKTMITLLFIMMLIFAVVGVMSSNQDNKTLTERTPLPAGLSIETSYYTDTLGWIKSSNTLEQGMKHFYKETGIQPHLYIVDNIDNNSSPNNNKAEEWLDTKYDELFKDEAHILVLLLDNGKDYGAWIMGGKETKTVMDNEAQGILLNYIDRYYSSSMDEDEMFSKVFSNTANSIMKVYENPFAKVMKKVMTFLIIITIGATIIGIMILVVKAKKEKREQDLAILNQSIDEISDDSISDITDKYK